MGKAGGCCRCIGYKEPWEEFGGGGAVPPNLCQSEKEISYALGKLCFKCFNLLANRHYAKILQLLVLLSCLNVVVYRLGSANQWCCEVITVFYTGTLHLYINGWLLPCR